MITFVTVFHRILDFKTGLDFYPGPFFILGPFHINTLCADSASPILCGENRLAYGSARGCFTAENGRSRGFAELFFEILGYDPCFGLSYQSRQLFF